MKTPRIGLAAFALLLALLSIPAFGADTAGWTCSMCGHGELEHGFAGPGACPVCGMPLVEISSVVQVGILVFDGVQIIDYTGPYEVFGQADFQVFLVSPDGKAITTTMNMKVVPHYGMHDAPQPDVLLVPGGQVQGMTSHTETLDWVRRTAAGAEHVLSVCNGAFILASAGLLDGLEATTFYGLIEDLESQFPKIEVVRDQRFVDNGKFITSAGLTSGIDASLHLVEKREGRFAAERLALHLEYQWDPESTYARGALADRHLPDISPPEGTEVSLVDQKGDRRQWTWLWDVQGDVSATDLANSIETSLREGGWSDSGPPSAGTRSCTFKGWQGEPWSGATAIKPVSEERFEVSIEIESSEL